MPRDDFDREEQRRRAALRDRDDYGQADYSTDYGYDARRRSGYRAEDQVRPRTDQAGQADYSRDHPYDPGRSGAYRGPGAAGPDYGRRMDGGDNRSVGQPRSWMDRAGAFFQPDPRPADAEARQRHRRGPSDRVLWAVIVERLEEERGLDLRAVDVIVEDGEVILSGRVRHKADRRRIEDIADVEGVRHVQNNLRVHENGHWTFF